MNREIYPGGLYPLSGDVQSTPGAPGVLVIGIQGVPVATSQLGGGEVLEYDPNIFEWVPTLRACIQVDNKTMSDDSIISVDVLKIPLINGA